MSSAANGIWLSCAQMLLALSAISSYSALKICLVCVRVGSSLKPVPMPASSTLLCIIDSNNNLFSVNERKKRQRQPNQMEKSKRKICDIGENEFAFFFKAYQRCVDAVLFVMDLARAPCVTLTCALCE